MTSLPTARLAPTTRTAGSAGGRAFTVCATIFLVAAVIAAAINAAAPFAHGWWLVAYLGLVGGVAQLMLGPGLIALAKRSGAQTMSASAARAELLLWNLGTVLVAVADMAAMPEGVALGSLLLLIALWLFARGLRQASATARKRVTGWLGAYAVLLGFLAISVLVGTWLAYRAH